MPLVFTLPANDHSLKAGLEQFLADYGEVQEAPPAFGLESLETVKLLFETISAFGGAGISITTLVYLLKEKFQQSKIRVGGPGEKDTPLAEVDEKILRRLEDLNR